MRCLKTSKTTGDVYWQLRRSWKLEISWLLISKKGVWSHHRRFMEFETSGNIWNSVHKRDVWWLLRHVTLLTPKTLVNTWDIIWFLFVDFWTIFRRLRHLFSKFKFLRRLMTSFSLASFTKFAPKPSPPPAQIARYRPISHRGWNTTQSGK